MAKVKFREGTSQAYNNTTPDEHTFYKVTHGTDSDNDELYLGTVKVDNQITETNPSNDTSYYIPFVTDISSATHYTTGGNNGLQYTTMGGTTATPGQGTLELGNAIPQGTSGNKTGSIKLYGATGDYYEISCPSFGPTETMDVELPTFTSSTTGGTGWLVGMAGGGNKGTASKPVYVDQYGIVNACDATVGGASTPVYMSSGTITVCTSTVGGTSTPVYMSAGTISACTATVGTTSIPVFMSAGRFYQCGDLQTILQNILNQLEDLEEKIGEMEDSSAGYFLDKYTPQQVVDIIDSGQAQNYWSVGDVTRNITLNGTVNTYTFDNTTVKAMIIDFDHRLEYETNSCHSMTLEFGQIDGVNIAFVDPDTYATNVTNATGFRMNSGSTNSGGWSSSRMRNTILSQFLEALPSNIQAVIKPTTKYTDNVGGTDSVSSITATQDQMFLPAEPEIFSSNTYSNSHEAEFMEQYIWYTNNNSTSARRRYKHNDISTAAYWWLRSPYKNDNYGFCCVTASGSAAKESACYSYGITPAFTLIGSTIVYTSNLEKCTPEEIKQIVISGQAANMWSVGDRTQQITLSSSQFNNETWQALLIGLDHNKNLETNGNYNACFQFGTTSNGINVALNGFCINNDATNQGGWEYSDMRTQTCVDLLAAMPTEWQNIVGTTTKYTDNTGYTGDDWSYYDNVTATQDQIFLLSGYEVFANTFDHCNSYEANYQAPYTYYNSNNRRIRYSATDTDKTVAWWTRSPDALGSSLWCVVSTAGAASDGFAYSSAGFAPAFTVF